MKTYKITKEWLTAERACVDGVDYYNTLNETDAVKIMDQLLSDKKLNFANWTICHLLKKEDKVRYAIFAARQVLPLWEKEYPCEAVIWKNWAENPTADRAAARAARAADRDARAVSAAARAARAAASDAAWAAWDARAVSTAAWAAASATCAVSAADMADRAADMADRAAVSAARAAAWDTAWYDMKLKIIQYGLGLFKEEMV